MLHHKLLQTAYTLGAPIHRLQTFSCVINSHHVGITWVKQVFVEAKMTAQSGSGNDLRHPYRVICGADPLCVRWCILIRSPTPEWSVRLLPAFSWYGVDAHVFIISSVTPNGLQSFRRIAAWDPPTLPLSRLRNRSRSLPLSTHGRLWERRSYSWLLYGALCSVVLWQSGKWHATGNEHAERI